MFLSLNPDATSLLQPASNCLLARFHHFLDLIIHKLDH
uniref:Uncharacterized protein n=1 Tax=Arundo donax TaxID=35708 RepID=A0A0A9G7Q9_ARUDO